MRMTTSRCLAFSLLALTGALALRAAEPIHALLITGGCCHDYKAQIKILTEGISARANVTWNVLFQGGDVNSGGPRSRPALPGRQYQSRSSRHERISRHLAGPGTG